MTDKEIIQALECCRDKIFKGCDNCPMDEDNDCIEIVCANAVDFINRQQTEIERLKARLEKKTTELDRLTIYFDEAVNAGLKTARAEAATRWDYTPKRDRTCNRTAWSS